MERSKLRETKTENGSSTKQVQLKSADSRCGFILPNDAQQISVTKSQRSRVFLPPNRTSELHLAIANLWTGEYESEFLNMMPVVAGSNKFNVNSRDDKVKNMRR